MSAQFDITVKVRVNVDGSGGDALLNAIDFGGDMAYLITDQFRIDEGDILGIEIQEVK